MGVKRKKGRRKEKKAGSCIFISELENPGIIDTYPQ
jgi:hypothetical protein